MRVPACGVEACCTAGTIEVDIWVRGQTKALQCAGVGWMDPSRRIGGRHPPRRGGAVAGSRVRGTAGGSSARSHGTLSISPVQSPRAARRTVRGRERGRVGHAPPSRSNWSWEDRPIHSGGTHTLPSGRSSYNLNFVDMENEWESVMEEEYANGSWVAYDDDVPDEEETNYEEEYRLFWKNASASTSSSRRGQEFLPATRLASLDSFILGREGLPPSVAVKIPSVLLSSLKLSAGSKEDRNQCGICLEDFHPDSVLYDLGCSHRFHIDCLRPWFARSHNCPMCRSNMYSDVPPE